ncbi:MAG: protein-methionine-sulfoxide reductase heme-binding subunit MsrQ, partial [Chloroflexota bacterium]|nr:protein-methionine-sulfoxide reductase heme-binding subunit MsrQ [Chloroflexota bacterium]
VLAWDFTQGQLTANPIREIQLQTGKYTLILLLLTLACGPVYTVLGFRTALRLRRTLGLYTFMYASVHLLNFVGLDYGFDFDLIRKDIPNKRFILAGFGAFLVLLLLAVTSTRGGMQWLGNNWKRLHRLIYVAALLAMLHFLWQAKADLREPFIYGAMVLFLLLLRVSRVDEVLGRGWNWLKREQRRQPTGDDISGEVDY